MELSEDLTSVETNADKKTATIVVRRGGCLSDSIHLRRSR